MSDDAQSCITQWHEKKGANQRIPCVICREDSLPIHIDWVQMPQQQRIAKEKMKKDKQRAIRRNSGEKAKTQERNAARRVAHRARHKNTLVGQPQDDDLGPTQELQDEVLGSRHHPFGVKTWRTFSGNRNSTRRGGAIKWILMT
ncbi:hypothetical protein DFH06DRAFT_1129188 [Mycena polygramma]|nr:hypothetical protein DFH06DRAFT_1129188 [Mycena polygramma]